MNQVYFLRPVGDRGPVKIGCGRSAANRLQGTRGVVPFTIEIAAFMAGGFDIEKRLHTKFQHLHIGHEWFNWSEELERVIEAVKAGVFDVATLPEARPLPSRRGQKPKPPYLKTHHKDQSVSYVKCRFIPLSEIAPAHLFEPILEAAE